LHKERDNKQFYLPAASLFMSAARPLCGTMRARADEKKQNNMRKGGSSDAHLFLINSLALQNVAVLKCFCGLFFHQHQRKRQKFIGPRSFIMLLAIILVRAEIRGPQPTSRFASEKDDRLSS